MLKNKASLKCSTEAYIKKMFKINIR